MLVILKAEPRGLRVDVNDARKRWKRLVFMELEAQPLVLRLGIIYGTHVLVQCTD